MRDNKCHRCGVRIGRADVRVATIIMVGPVDAGLTPDQALDHFADRLSPYQRANLAKKIARSVYCGGCGAALTAGIPDSEVARINTYASTES